MNLSEIENRIQEGNLTPHEAADFRVTLSGLYSRTSGELESLLLLKPKRWMAIRDTVKSDKSADRTYEGTIEGLKEMQLRFQLKKFEKLMSALSSLIRVAETEARNIF